MPKRKLSGEMQPIYACCPTRALSGDSNKRSKTPEVFVADTSWFSRRVVEKLAALRQTSRPDAIGADFEDLRAIANGRCLADLSRAER
jgi:hypothetical protein